MTSSAFTICGGCHGALQPACYRCWLMLSPPLATAHGHSRTPRVTEGVVRAGRWGAAGGDAGSMSAGASSAALSVPGGTLVAARPARSRGRVCIRTRLRHGVSARVRAGGAVVGAAWVRTISDADPARGAGGRSAVVSRVRRGRCSLYSLYFTICTRYVISTYVLYLGLNPELSRSAFNGP